MMSFAYRCVAMAGMWCLGFVCLGALFESRTAPLSSRALAFGSLIFAVGFGTGELVAAHLRARGGWRTALMPSALIKVRAKGDPEELWRRCHDLLSHLPNVRKVLARLLPFLSAGA